MLPAQRICSHADLKPKRGQNDDANEGKHHLSSHSHTLSVSATWTTRAERQITWYAQINAMLTATASAGAESHL